MYFTFFIGFVSVLFAWLSGALNNKKYLIVSFLILFIYLALRYDFGNDYMTYYDLFYRIKDSSWDELMLLARINEFGETMEFGYIFLNKFFSLFSGFFFFIAFHSFLLCLVYYFLIKKYVQPRYYWIALFVLILHTSLMVRSLSGLRQGLAVFCFIYSFQFLIEKRSFWKYALCVLFATLFHYSAIILIPFYFFFNTSGIKKYESLMALFLYVFIILGGDLLIKPIEGLTNLLFPKYYYYLENEEGVKLGSGFGLFLSSLLYIFILFSAKMDTTKDRIFYRIVMVYIIISPISLIINNLARLSLYFAPALLIVIPQLMTTSKPNKLIKMTFIIFYFLITIYGAYGHYTSPVFIEKNYNYKSILTIQQM